jgi:hypothetical protein
MEVARIELGEMRNEMRRRVTLASGEALHARDELGIGEVAEGREEVVLHSSL